MRNNIRNYYGRIPRKLKKRLRDSASPRLFGFKWKRKLVLLNAIRAYYDFLYKRKLRFYYNFGSIYQDLMLKSFGYEKI